MTRVRTVFVCRECGYESAGWLGKCPACNNWNTFSEELPVRDDTGARDALQRDAEPVSIASVTADVDERRIIGIGELDRVLGGGVVRGSLVLVGGDPGIGKSTLLLQACEYLGRHGTVLYVSGEESAAQIKLRADRLGVSEPKLFVVSETDFGAVSRLIEKEKPSFVVVDSIQTLYDARLASSPGSVSQVRDVTAGLLKIAKSTGISVFIIGHVTKEGAIAGPRVLEHMVDTVLYFEGDRHLNYRVLRAVKNRFGSTNEIGVFEMRDAGLAEVENPSLAMLSGRPGNVPGTVVVAGMEGTRPMLMEIQALVCATAFGMPRRMANGADYNRVTILMAVLEKRVGLQLGNCDAYVNVIGGLRIDEPACDLGIVAAVASSFRNIPIGPETVLIGEVGLTGEIRAVSHIGKRITEAARIGFKRCVIPAGNAEGNAELAGILNRTPDLAVDAAADVREALNMVL